MRYDTYANGEHYQIVFRDGIHKVLKETPYFMPDNEVVFTGHYEDCVDWINNELEKENRYEI